MPRYATTIRFGVHYFGPISASFAMIRDKIATKDQMDSIPACLLLVDPNDRDEWPIDESDDCVISSYGN